MALLSFYFYSNCYISSGGDVLLAVQSASGRIVAEIIAEGQSDPVALESFCDRFLRPRRQVAQAVIEKGIQSGEFASGIDPEIALDIFYGPIYYILSAVSQTSTVR